jgi:hypothetical protein
VTVYERDWLAAVAVRGELGELGGGRGAVVSAVGADYGDGSVLGGSGGGAGDGSVLGGDGGGALWYAAPLPLAEKEDTQENVDTEYGGSGQRGADFGGALVEQGDGGGLGGTLVDQEDQKDGGGIGGTHVEQEDIDEQEDGHSVTATY